jgi:hypothetical protein
LNLSSNRIEEKGIDYLLREILSSDRVECAMICLHISGNPGCDERILETLSHIALGNLRHPIFSNESHFEIMETIFNWLNEQKGEGPLRELLLSHSFLSDMKVPHRRLKEPKDANGLPNGRVAIDDDHDRDVEDEEELLVYDEPELEEDEEQDDAPALNQSRNGSRDYSHNLPHDQEPYRHQQHQQSAYDVSADVLSLQSDERIYSSQQAQPRYPPQESLIESFDFDGYSPSQHVGYNDIDGRRALLWSLLLTYSLQASKSCKYPSSPPTFHRRETTDSS